jgi:hypothetical protein
VVSAATPKEEALMAQPCKVAAQGALEIPEGEAGEEEDIGVVGAVQMDQFQARTTLAVVAALDSSALPS